MDFVVKEFIFPSYFWLSLGAFGFIVEPFPENQVVLAGTINVTVTCFSNTSAKAIYWSLNQVGVKKERVIKKGDKIVDREFDGVLNPDSNSFTIFIKIASVTTAGTYNCLEVTKSSVQLIVLSEPPSCGFAPKETKQLPCNATLELSCAVSYAANTLYVYANNDWSTEASSKDIANSDDNSATPGNITTTTSILKVTWPMDTDIPVYICKTTFSMNSAGIAAKEFVKKEPKYQNLCKPFTSPNDVLCIGRENTNKLTTKDKKGDNKPGGTTQDTTDTTDLAEKKLDTGGGWSVGLSDTNNIVIRVFGVAGVLLLAQVLVFEEE